jgi:DNA excision repair protein ERCC-2
MTPKSDNLPDMEFTVSVRDLAEHVMRAGDLRAVFVSSARAVMGTRGHRSVQKDRPSDYQPEVSLAETFQADGVRLRVQGRADGLYTGRDPLILDEIKTTTRNVDDIAIDDNPVHWAQAILYAAIIARQSDLAQVCVQVTYYGLSDRRSKEFQVVYDRADLEAVLAALVGDYLTWARALADWQIKRQASLEALEFPFSTYRAGQRELMVTAWKSILDRRRAFLQAPTGIGKTIGVLFPALKAMGRGEMNRIAYLTARTVGRLVAEETLERLRQTGALVRAVTLTAKDTICFNEETRCDSDTCSFAQGHFDRVNAAIADGLALQALTRVAIEDLARKHRVCPFELSLDLAGYADVVIGDYNYVFDPRVSLRRLVESETDPPLLLIDEAHNLVDRAREMYSADLSKGPVMDLARRLADIWPQGKKALNAVNKALLNLRKQCEEANVQELVLAAEPDALLQSVRRFVSLADTALMEFPDIPERTDLLDLYFKGLRLVRTADWMDERYRVLVERLGKNDVRCRFYCLDPSALLAIRLEAVHGSLFFSATLTPLAYFQRLFGNPPDPIRVALGSPFPEENRLLLIRDDIPTTYARRNASYQPIAESIKTVIDSHAGNYLVFFPSYRYLADVRQSFEALKPECELLIQPPGMPENERVDFLNAFQPEPVISRVGFVVMGGIFGEGIDLVGERLHGAIVVGVGLPQVCLEREQIRAYFDDLGDDGFAYAYQYPGLTRVLQAAGRVIRTENDRGIILAIDSRFSFRDYLKLLPLDWQRASRVQGESNLAERLDRFWRKSTD